MNALNVQNSTIFDYMENLPIEKENSKKRLFLNEFDPFLFDEYIEPQFNWAWNIWQKTNDKNFLDLSIFWLDQCIKLKNKIDMIN